MIIKKRRIRNLSSFSNLTKGIDIRLGISISDENMKFVNEIGFMEPLTVGDTLLPSIVGPVTKRNAEGYDIIHKDRKKETKYRMVEWTYKEWAGRWGTNEVTKSTDVPYERFPRTHVPPESIELTIIDTENGKKIVSPLINLNDENEDLIVHITNILLEIFGECEVLNKESEMPYISKLIKTNWDILPKGKMPWEKRKESINLFFDITIGDNKNVVKNRLEAICTYEPDFTAIGKAGFSGYIIFGFVEKNIYVLESIQVNNATYVLENDWESISQLTKAEILNNDLHKDRVIHTKNWYYEMDNILNGFQFNKK